MDPDVALTEAPFAYASDDPVNEADPSGLANVGERTETECELYNNDKWIPEGSAPGAGHCVPTSPQPAILFHFIAHHPLQFAAIVGGVVIIVAGTVLTGGLADALLATSADLVAEGGVVANLEAADLAIHAPFVLGPGITVIAIGGGTVGGAIYSLATGGGPKTECP